MPQKFCSSWILAVLLMWMTGCTSALTPTLVPTVAIAPLKPTPTTPKSSTPTTNLTNTQSAPQVLPTITIPIPPAPPAGDVFKGRLSVLIYAPQDNSEVQTAQVVVSGEADPETVISVNDQIAVAGPDRQFSVSITLEDGPNAVEITASDESGSQGTAYLTLFYNAQP